MTIPPLHVQSNTATPPQPRRGLLAGALLCATLSLSLITLVLAGEQTALYLPILLLLLLTALPLAIGAARREIDLLEPIYWLAFIFALYFPFRALYAILVLQPAERTWVGLYIDYYADLFPTTLLYAVLGFTALLVGYYSALPAAIVRLLPSLPLRWSEQPPLGKIVLIYAAGMVSSIGLYAIILPHLGTRADTSGNPFIFYLIALSQCVKYAFLIAAIYLLRGRTSPGVNLFFWAVLVPTVILTAFWFQEKNHIIFPFFFFMVAYNYLRRRLSLTKLVLPALILGIVVFPLVNAYRGPVVRSMGVQPESIEDVLHNVSYIPEYFSGVSPDEYVVLAFEQVMVRSNGIDMLSLVVESVPERIEYRYGVDYALIPAYAFIPRLIWPDKPGGRSLEFTHMFILGRGHAANPNLHINITNIADLYLNFGLAGILAGMFLLGIIYRAAYLSLAPWRSGNAPGVFLYAITMVLLLHGFEQDITTVYSVFLKYIPLWLALCWFLQERTSGTRSMR
jgi:hypothetical protein